MLKISDVNKTLIKSIVILAFIGFGIGAFITHNILLYGIGVVIGTLTSILKVILLERSLNRAVDMQPQDAENYTRLQYSSRFFFTVAVLVISAIVPFIDLYGVIVGLVLIQPAVYLTNFIRKEEPG